MEAVSGEASAQLRKRSTGEKGLPVGRKGTFSNLLSDEGLMPTTHKEDLAPTNKNPKYANHKMSRVGPERGLSG